jgi:hypothetical protein
MTMTQTPDTEKTTDQSFIAKVQDKASAATDATVTAVKDHPVAAAAIGAGVAAAVAGAAFGISKLREGDDAD